MARHGENIHKRKDGRWEGRYIKGRSETGKAIWGYVYIAKNSTTRAYPTPTMALCRFCITPHTAPPLKDWGPVVTSPHNSVSFPFHVENALFRFSTIQFWFKVSPSFG